MTKEIKIPTAEPKKKHTCSEFCTGRSHIEKVEVPGPARIHSVTVHYPPVRINDIVKWVLIGLLSGVTLVLALALYVNLRVA